MLGHGLAICAGFCAAMASSCAKLAFSSKIVNQMCQSVFGLLPGNFQNEFCGQGLWVLQVLLFGLLFVFNALMWTLFVKSMQKCNSSMEATVINTATNFFFSGVIGWLVFQETLSLLWWLGATHIILGIILIHHSTEQTETSQSPKKYS